MKKCMYSIGDCDARELHIYHEEYDADLIGEFSFETLQEAKDACLERIDEEIEALQRTRKQILDTKL